jgi:hypothetical protein
MIPPWFLDWFVLNRDRARGGTGSPDTDKLIGCGDAEIARVSIIV